MKRIVKVVKKILVDLSVSKKPRTVKKISFSFIKLA